MPAIAALVVGGLAAGAGTASGFLNADSANTANRHNLALQKEMLARQLAYNDAMLHRMDAPQVTPYGSSQYDPFTGAYETRLNPLVAALTASSIGNQLRQAAVDTPAIEQQLQGQRALQNRFMHTANADMDRAAFARSNTMSNLDASGLLALDKLGQQSGALDTESSMLGAQAMRSQPLSGLADALRTSGRNNVFNATSGNAVPGIQLANELNSQRIGGPMQSAASSASAGAPTQSPFSDNSLASALSQQTASKQASVPQQYAVAKSGLDTPQGQPTQNGVGSLAQGLGALSSALAMYGGVPGSSKSGSVNPSALTGQTYDPFAQFNHRDW